MQERKINKGEYPVYVKFYDFPIQTQKSKHAEYLVASAAIKVVGAEAFRGLMICEFSGNPGERPGLWKLFLWNEVARAKLVSQGIVLEDIAIEVYSNNPLRKVNDDGIEIDETKLTISNVPPSFDDEEIITNLKKRGVNVTSKIRMDFIRNPDGKLSSKESGRRTVWMELPEKPLPKVIQVGPIKVKLYHKEMKRCLNCLQTGHDRRNCTNKMVCHFCKEEGHKTNECAKKREAEENEKF